MLRYLTIPVTAFQQNSSIVWCDATKQAAVIDPGGDLPRIQAEAQRRGLTLAAIGFALLTVRPRLAARLERANASLGAFSPG